MDRVYTVLFAGVGGQGVIKAGDILAQAAFLSGLDVKKSEVHGLSRRFGSVSCQVRFGAKVGAPLRGHGSADFVVALEALEGLRHLPYLAPDGLALIFKHWIPVSGPAGQSGDSGGGTSDSRLHADDRRIRWLVWPDRHGSAEKPKAGLNVFLLGILATLVPLEDEAWFQALQSEIPRNHEQNLTLFRAGRQVTLTPPE
jgi:indolepyruvate ferredoxin oxidoreductase beta subunit